MDDQDRFARGIEVLEQVYGAGAGAMMKGAEGSPMVSDTVAHLFGDIWSRPGLSLRAQPARRPTGCRPGG